MKKMKLMLMLLQIFIAGSLIAQTDIWDYNIYSVGKIYPGYIIKANGDKVEGYIEAQYRGEIAGVGNSNQTRLEFYTDPKDKKTKELFKPEDLKSYMIADKYYKSMQYSGGLMKAPYRFLLQVVGGEIAQYTWYTNTGVSNGVYIWEEKMVFQKGDGEPKSIDEFGLKFADKMSAWVSDHKELAAKVSGKEKGYGVLNILEIITEYNAWHEENNK